MRSLFAAAAAAVTLMVMLLIPGAARAEDEFAALMRVLRVGDTVEIMRREGMRYGDEIAEDMLPDADSATWMVTVGRIYDADKMQDLVEQTFADALKGADLAPMLAFFESDLGREVIALELAAREAFLEPATEEAAQIRYQEAVEAGDQAVGQIEEMIADSDLIELNVMGALNSNLSFYRGLVDGGAFELGEDEMLADVWGQEDSIRADTVTWLGAYLLTAYQPLSAAEMDAYIDFYRSDAGQALNATMFAAFDRMYEEISYLLGRAVAEHMRSQEL